MRAQSPFNAARLTRQCTVHRKRAGVQESFVSPVFTAFCGCGRPKVIEWVYADLPACHQMGGGGKLVKISQSNVMNIISETDFSTRCHTGSVEPERERGQQ